MPGNCFLSFYAGDACTGPLVGQIGEGSPPLTCFVMEENRGTNSVAASAALARSVE